jgi:hypothetical protein
MNSNNPLTSPRQPGSDGTEARPPETNPKKLDLSLSQTLGGALAAMTAAALGSRLGVAGTIVGAAIASIIAGVAGAFYTASLRTTREKVKTVWSGRIAGTETRASVDVVPETPVWDEAEPSSTSRPRRSVPWKAMLGGTIAAFVLAAVALTGFELLSGSALSGGGGTTFQQVTKEKKPTKEPSSKATDSDSDSPSASTSETPTEDPSTDATTSEAPEPTGTTSEAPPSSESSEAATEQPTEAPSSTEAPSTDATPEPTDEGTPAG